MHIHTCWEYELGAPGLGVGMIKKIQATSDRLSNTSDTH